MEERVEAMLRINQEAECRLRKQLTDDRTTSHWCYVPMKASLVGADNECHATEELILLLCGLPSTKTLYTIVSSVETQNLEKRLEASVLQAREIEKVQGENSREMMAHYALEKRAAEDRIRALKQALHKEKSKNTQRSKEVENIEEEKEEESVAHSLGVPCLAVHEGRQAEDGADEVRADPVRAVERYNRLIEERGNVIAMTNLAILLKAGADGVPANPIRAVHLYNRAIEDGGNVFAMNNLANLLKAGADGVPANPVRAVHLYNRAIEEGGYVIAMKNLARLLRRGADGVPVDRVRAAHLEKRAIDEGPDVGASPAGPSETLGLFQLWKHWWKK